MASKFDGFSQDEINKVSGGGKGRGNQGHIIADAIKPAFRGQHGGIRRMPEKWSRSTESQRKQPTSSQSSVKSAPTVLLSAKTGTNENVEKKTDCLEEINLDDSMSKSIEEALFYQPLRKQTELINARKTNATNGAMAHSNELDDSSILKLPNSENNVSSTSAETDESSILPTAAPKVSTPPTETLNTDSPFKGVSLREFETHRKLIQEQNKQKKELLHKAIELHSQKTAAETRKIAEIKQELAKLDNDLALDVSILRKQIDNACIYFSQVEKQYNKIEAQFLKAKIDLHNAAEKKELLTEHLCTVIAHNEDRKAQKLSELMQKVGLTETGELDTGVQNAVNGENN